MSVAPEGPIKGEGPEIASTSPSPSPEDLAIDGHDDGEGLHGTPPPPPKRKGGRKPIYTTSEERKQRNRQAQAAFRERRTEYIKQLEITLKQNEETVSNLRRSHRSATEECHLLRYRNSLLERILIEKGFDVQTELQLRGASPTTARPQHPSPAASDAPIAQQAMMNRHQQAIRQPTSISSSKGEQPFDVAPPMQTLRMSPSAASQSHSHTPTSSQFPSPAQGYRASPGSFSTTTASSFVPQVHQSQPQQQMMPEQHHQQQPPTQYQYNQSNTWASGPIRGTEQQYPQHDVSSYDYPDVNSYGGMSEPHHQQHMMHHAGAQHIDPASEPRYRQSSLRQSEQYRHGQEPSYASRPTGPFDQSMTEAYSPAPAQPHQPFASSINSEAGARMQLPSMQHNGRQVPQPGSGAEPYALGQQGQYPGSYAYGQGQGP